MKGRRAAAKYLPTITKARKARIGLPSGAPTEEHKLCALMVHANVLVRDVWSEQAALSRADMKVLKRSVPKAGKPGAVHHVLGPVIKYARNWTRARVDHYSDTLRTLHDVWIPTELAEVAALTHFELALETVVLSATPPEALRCLDLQPRSHGGAYRAAPTKRLPDFHGYGFGGTIRRARRAVHTLSKSGTVLRGDVRAYAWPLLWLRYRKPSQPRLDYVLFVDPDGALRAIAGSEDDGSHGRPG